jgi:(p)ppGpp synthase/HD superfamily hydrolase
MLVARHNELYYSWLQITTNYKRNNAMTPRFTKAISLAAEAHEGQERKGTGIPYITHPVAVAALVARYGGDEDQQIGALLHDVLEDAGEDWTPRIAEFGERVLSIVRACTDGTPDALTGQKAPWRERKEAYLAHLSDTPDDALLVSACDKLHNIQAIYLDLTEVGPAVFDRFTASRDETLWYYRSLAEIFSERKIAPVGAILRQYDKIVAALQA